MAHARSAPSSAALALPGLGDVVRAETTTAQSATDPSPHGGSGNHGRKGLRPATSSVPLPGLSLTAPSSNNGRLTLTDLARLDAVQAGARASTAARDAAGVAVENCALPCWAYECSEKRDRGDPWCERHGALLGYSDSLREIHARGTEKHDAVVAGLRGVIAARQGKRIPTPAEERAAREAERAEAETRRVRLTGHLCGSACAVNCPRRWVPQLAGFFPRPTRATWELSEEVRAGLAALPANWGARIVQVASLPKELQERIRAREAQEGRDHIFSVVEREASSEFRQVIEAAAARYEADRRRTNGDGAAPVEGTAERGEREAPIVCVLGQDEDPVCVGASEACEVQEPARRLDDDDAALYAPRLDDRDPDEGAFAPRARYEAERNAKNGELAPRLDAQPNAGVDLLVSVWSDPADEHDCDGVYLPPSEASRSVAVDEAAMYAPRLDDCDPGESAADLADGPRGATAFRAAAWARFDVTGRAGASRWNPRSPRFVHREWWAHLGISLARMRDDSRYAAESGHGCHARGCAAKVPPRLLMCGSHWRRVPKELQEAVWKTYRRGQETDKRPTREYLAAADDAIEAVAWVEWWERREARNR